MDAAYFGECETKTGKNGPLPNGGETGKDGKKRCRQGGNLPLFCSSFKPENHTKKDRFDMMERMRDHYFVAIIRRISWRWGSR